MHKPPDGPVDAYASQPHFLDHIAPLWRALDDRIRGTFLVDRSIASHARRRGIDAQAGTSHQLRGRTGPVLVAGVGDLRRVARRRRAIYMEHGAGQTYLTKHHSYAGGGGRSAVGLFLNPSARVEGLNRAAWPSAAQATIGSPRLDRFHGEAARTAARFPAAKRRPTIAVTFHWDCLVVPETRGALAHYRPALEQLAAGPWEVIGHGHPRLFDDGAARLRQAYAQVGIRIEEDLEEVLEQADVLAADNTSALFEFASTGKPVVVMNAPWYRRDVQHGMRFWEYADIGVQVDDPSELAAALGEALADRPARRRRREEISTRVYANRDGTAAAAGAAAIAEWLSFRAERAA
jgi:glycosyltransferase involved in cell wall biosynthesis